MVDVIIRRIFAECGLLEFIFGCDDSYNIVLDKVVVFAGRNNHRHNIIHNQLDIVCCVFHLNGVNRRRIAASGGGGGDGGVRETIGNDAVDVIQTHCIVVDDIGRPVMKRSIAIVDADTIHVLRNGAHWIQAYIGDSIIL